MTKKNGPVSSKDPLRKVTEQADGKVTLECGHVQRIDPKSGHRHAKTRRCVTCGKNEREQARTWLRSDERIRKIRQITLSEEACTKLDNLFAKSGHARSRIIEQLIMAYPNKASLAADAIE